MERELGTKAGEDRRVTEAREFCRAILRAFPGAKITVRESSTHPSKTKDAA